MKLCIQHKGSNSDFVPSFVFILKPSSLKLNVQRTLASRHSRFYMLIQPFRDAVFPMASNPTGWQTRQKPGSTMRNQLTKPWSFRLNVRYCKRWKSDKRMQQVVPHFCGKNTTSTLQFQTGDHKTNWETLLFIPDLSHKYSYQWMRVHSYAKYTQHLRLVQLDSLEIPQDHVEIHIWSYSV